MCLRGSGSTSLLLQDNVVVSGNAAAGQCADLKCAGGAIAAYDKSTLTVGAGCSLVNNRYEAAAVARSLYTRRRQGRRL